jgi:hypothetical protein
MTTTTLDIPFNGIMVGGIQNSAETSLLEPASKNQGWFGHQVSRVENGIIGAAKGVRDGIVGAANCVKNSIVGTIYGIGNGMIYAGKGVGNGVIYTAKGIAHTANGAANGVVYAVNGIARGVVYAAKGTANGAVFATSSIIKLTQAIFSSISLVVADTPMVAGIFRKLDQHVLRFLEEVKNAPGSLSRFQLFIKHNVSFIDFVQLVSDVDYLAMGRFKEKRNENGEIVKTRDSNFLITGKASILAADVGGALLWLQEMGFYKLSNVAATMGEVRLFSAMPQAVSSIPVVRDLAQAHAIANVIGELRVFSFVKNLNCLFVTLRALDLAYACFAIDAGRRFFSAENINQKISAGLDFSSYLSELILSASLLAGATSVVGLGLGASTCIGLALTSFLYRLAYANEIKQIVQMEPIK